MIIKLFYFFDELLANWFNNYKFRKILLISYLNITKFDLIFYFGNLGLYLFWKEGSPILVVAPPNKIIGLILKYFLR